MSTTDRFSISFRAERYFGKDRQEIRRTRVLAAGQIDWLPPIMLANTHGVVVEETTTSCAKEATLAIENISEVIEV